MFEKKNELPNLVSEYELFSKKLDYLESSKMAFRES